MRNKTVKRRPPQLRLKRLKRPLTQPEAINLFILLSGGELAYTIEALTHLLNNSVYHLPDDIPTDRAKLYRVHNLIESLQTLQL